MLTPHQLEANRLNARLSTGPQTPVGKAASRVNALKSGLSGRGLILPEHEAGMARARRAELQKALGANRDAWTDILLETIAVESVRVERCRQEEGLVREREALEASILWVEDRTLEALGLGAKLASNPESVRIELEKTLHGVEWMLGRWGILGRALDLRGTWDEAETALAIDLLGPPGLVRDAMSDETLDARKATVAGQIDRLRGLRASRMTIDEHDRDLAEVGISARADARIKTIRRYETASRRAIEKAAAELRRHQGSAGTTAIDRQVSAWIDPKPPARYETNPPEPAVDEPADEEAGLSDEEAYLHSEKPAQAAPAERHVASLPAPQRNRKQRRAMAARQRRAG